MMHNKVTAENVVAKTRSVWWHIDRCPIPRGYDLYQVRPSIESTMEKYFGGPGPLTIIAIGDVKLFPRSFLEPLSSTGIIIKHADLGVIDICMDIHMWAMDNHPPATIMVISDNSTEECFKYTLSSYRDERNTVLRAYPNRQRAAPKYASKVWLWKSLLTDAMGSGSADTKQETRRHECIGMGQPRWVCRLCRVTAHSFDNITTHLEGQEHAMNVSILASSTACIICIVHLSNHI